MEAFIYFWPDSKDYKSFLEFKYEKLIEIYSYLKELGYNVAFTQEDT